MSLLRTVDRLLAGNLSTERSEYRETAEHRLVVFRSRGQVADLSPALSHTRTVTHTVAQLLLLRGLSPHPQKTLNRVLMSVEKD